MRLQIIKNTDEEMYAIATQAVQDNDGFCPCYLHNTPETKCPCKKFRESTTVGECQCGRYMKIEISD